MAMVFRKINNLKDAILKEYLIIALLLFIFVMGFIIYSKIAWAAYFFVMSISYMLIYLIFKYLNINLLLFDKIYYILFLLPLFLAIGFSNTNLYFNFSIYDLNNTLIKKMSVHDNQIYEVNYNKIIDEKHNVVFKAKVTDFGVDIQKGELEVKDKKVGYKIEVKDKGTFAIKCIVKDINSEKYKIFDESCEETEDK